MTSKIRSMRTVRPTRHFWGGVTARPSVVVPSAHPKVRVKNSRQVVWGDRQLGRSVDVLSRCDVVRAGELSWEHDLTGYEDVVVLQPKFVRTSVRRSVPQGCSTRLSRVVALSWGELVNTVVGVGLVATMTVATIAVLVAFFSVSNAPLG